MGCILVGTDSFYRLRRFYGKNKASKLPYTPPQTQCKASLSNFVYGIWLCASVRYYNHTQSAPCDPMLLVGNVIIVYVVNRLPLYYFTT